MALLEPMPQQEPLVQDVGPDESGRPPKPLYMTGRWLQWFYNALTVRLNQVANRIGTLVELLAQNATIAATPIALPAISAGRYRIHWYARVTTVDAVSSSLTVTIGWVESGQALTVQGPAITGNTVTSVQSGTVYAEVDSATAITYATTYVSNTPGQMKYRLSVQVESLP